MVLGSTAHGTAAAHALAVGGTQVEAAAQQQPAAPALCHEVCAHAGLAACRPGLVYGIIWAPEQAANVRASPFECGRDGATRPGLRER